MNSIMRLPIAAMMLIAAGSLSEHSNAAPLGLTEGIRSASDTGSVVEQVQFFCEFDNKLRCGFGSGVSPDQGAGSAAGTGSQGPEGPAGSAGPGTIPLSDVIDAVREYRDRKKKPDKKTKGSASTGPKMCRLCESCTIEAIGQPEHCHSVWITEKECNKNNVFFASKGFPARCNCRQIECSCKDKRC
jgi:hypothetical protein